MQAVPVIAQPVIRPFPAFGWMGCCMMAASSACFFWPAIYQASYELAAEQVRRERLRQQWWEPSLN